MVNRSRNISGEILNTRTLKAYILKLKSSKYLILVVIIFSAWLSLHFVRATTEYHMQAASERGEEQVMNNLDGVIKVHHDDDVIRAENSISSTSPTDTRPGGKFQSNHVGRQDTLFQDRIKDATTATFSPSTRGFTSLFKSKIEALAGVRRTIQPGTSTTELSTDTNLQYQQPQGAWNNILKPASNELKYPVRDPAIGRDTGDVTSNPVSTSTEWTVTRSYEIVQNLDNKYEGQINSALHQQYDNLRQSQNGGPNNPIGNAFNSDPGSSTPAVATRPINVAQDFRDSFVQPVNNFIEPVRQIRESSTDSRPDLATSDTSTPVYQGRLAAILMPSAYNNNNDDNKGDDEKTLIYSNNNNGVNKGTGQTNDNSINVNGVNMDKLLDQNNINNINNNNIVYSSDRINNNNLNNNYNNGNVNSIANNNNNVNSNYNNVDNGYNGNNVNTGYNDNNSANNGYVNTGYNDNNNVNNNLNNVNKFNVNNDYNGNNVNSGYIGNNNVNNGYVNTGYNDNNNANNGYVNAGYSDNNNVNNGYIGNKVNSIATGNNNINDGYVNTGYNDNNLNNNLNNVNNGYNSNNVNNGYNGINNVNNGYVNTGYNGNNNVNNGYANTGYNDNNNVNNGYNSNNNVNSDFNNVNNDYNSNNNVNNNFNNVNTGYNINNNVNGDVNSNNNVNSDYNSNNNVNNDYNSNNNVNNGYNSNSNVQSNFNNVNVEYNSDNIVNNGYNNLNNDNNNINNGYNSYNMDIFKSDINLDIEARENDGSTTMTPEDSVTSHMIGNTAPNINQNDKILKIENEQQFIVNHS